MSKIDANQQYVALGWDGTAAVPLKVDAATGRLLIEITPVTDSVSVLHDGKPDDNHEYVSIASDGTNTKALLIDHRNGFLYCDVLDEG